MDVSMWNVLQVICLLCCSEARPTKQKHSFFHNTGDLNNVVFDQDLIQDLACTRVRCAALCHREKTCRSYFYNKKSHRCRTHSTLFGDNTGARPEEGWIYYGRRPGRQKTANIVTTEAPGLESGPKFAQNATTPKPDVLPDDDEEEDFDATSPDTTLDNQRPSTMATTSASESKTTFNSDLTSSRDSSTFASVAVKDDWTTTLLNIIIKPFFRLWTDGTISSTETVLIETHASSSKQGVTNVDTKRETTVATEADDKMITEAESKSLPSSTHTISETNRNPGSESFQATPSKDSKLGRNFHHPPTAHDEDLHDHLDFLSPEEQTIIMDMSTGLAMKDTTDEMNGETSLLGMSTSLGIPGDDDEEVTGAITIVMVVGDDEDDDDDDTTEDLLIQPDTSFGMMDIEDQFGHTQSHELQTDKLTYMNVGTPTIGDLLGITDADQSKATKPDSENLGTEHLNSKYHGLHAMGDRIKSPASTSVHNTSSAARIAAMIIAGVLLSIIGAFMFYRRRKTGSWTLMRTRDDGLGLQLIQTT